MAGWNHSKERQQYQRSASSQRAPPAAAAVRSGLADRHPPRRPGTSKIAAPPTSHFKVLWAFTAQNAIAEQAQQELYS